MRLLIKILMPMIVLAAAAWAGMSLLESGPEPARKTPKPVVPLVEVMELQPTEYQIRVRSRGTVSPRTQSTLIPEVAGRVVEVAPGFRNGGFFEPGEVLVRIDPRDHEHALTMARSELAQARVALQEEEAQAGQARRDWAQLKMEVQPSGLVLRRPQLESRRAAVAAAEARVERARTDLERTGIRAPYAGRVLEKRADLGQYVAPGTVLATLYAIDYVEVRLPLTDRQAAFVDLPESYRGEQPTAKGPVVTLSASLGGTRAAWTGRIVRTEGAIDLASRQLFVVVQVDDPYTRRDDGRPPLKVGQFVEAEIQGRQLERVFVIPRELLRAGDGVLVITPEFRVQRRALEVGWRDETHVVVTGGLTAGERIATTPLGFPVDGTPVRLRGAGDAEPDRRGEG